MGREIKGTEVEEKVGKEESLARGVAELLPGKDVGREVALQRKGLHRELLYETIRDGLRAETVVYDREGREVGRVPDHNARAKFVGSAVEVLGEKMRGEEGSKIPSLIIVLPDGRRV